MQSAGEALAELATSHEDAARFFDELFGQLERSWGEMSQRHQTWQKQQQQTERALREQAEALTQERAALAAERERMREEVRAALVAEGTAAAAEQEELKRRLAEVEKERAALIAAREAAEAQFKGLSQATAGLAEVRQELQQERAERGTGPAGGAGAIDDETRQQIHALEQECAVLETELETVRGRAAEMAETLAQQERQRGEERLQWGEELRRMRQLMEAMAQRDAQRQIEVESQPPSGALRGGATKGQGGEGADPVLSSVMAQFEMLQKDLARRRKVAASSG